jgi:5-formyltetrahydrofolate cyclo-ligase
VDGLRGWIIPNDYLTVLVFLPMTEEVNLMPLMERDSITRFVATRTPDRGELSVHELGGPLEVHRFGFLQPHSSAPVVAPDEIDIALLPGLAFDLFGNRLGRGAGYFDRLLSFTREDAMRVGVVPVKLVVDRLPADPHDVPVEFLATEEGVTETA